MNRLFFDLRTLGLFCLALAGLLWLSGAFFADSAVVGASSLVQATPTCPAQPSGCVQARIYGYQSTRYSVRTTFNDAAVNNLGTNAPTYPLIAQSLPPVTYETISSGRPIPQVILRGMGWQESRWKQFANDKDADPDGAYFCTFVPTNCGYGLMQITSYMGGGGGFEPSRVAGELTYNLGTGVYFLIDKWNWMSRPTVRLIGSNDHTVPENWYYAVTAYNQWDVCNDPNRNYRRDACPEDRRERFYPDRHPYREENYSAFSYPYQEVIWGWTAHPEEAHPVPIPYGWHGLWRPTRNAWVPRGIWGLSGSWRPPEWTPKPVLHLLPSIQVANGTGPTIVLHNPTGYTLAADVALYSADHTFSRWWLGRPPNPSHDYPYPYIRLAPSETRSLPVTAVFNSGQTFTGYARVSASEGVAVTLQPPSYPHKVFLPLALNNYGGNCANGVVNGGFEAFENGKPQSWNVTSADGYPLADGTWFISGHYGAYLGGYDNANDTLWQSIAIPGDALQANLTCAWYMQSQESLGSSVYDQFYIRLRNTNGSLVTTLGAFSNTSPRDTWQTATYSLLPYKGQSLRLSFEATTDYYSNPTSFFVDNVSLWICRP